jgi:hypothetical protein
MSFQEQHRPRGEKPGAGRQPLDPRIDHAAVASHVRNATRLGHAASAWPPPIFHFHQGDTPKLAHDVSALPGLLLAGPQQRADGSPVVGVTFA